MDGMAMREKDAFLPVGKWDRRILENRRRRRAEVRRRVFLLLFAAAFLCAALVCANGMVSRAREAENKDFSVKYYKNICVERGETLTSIARAYADKEHYGTLAEYIEEVAYMNHLENADDIGEGCYLIIPYYAAIE